MELRTKLRQIPLFRDLTPPELARVDEIAVQRVFRKKAIIFLEGGEKEAVYFILDGWIKTYKTNWEGQEQIVSLLQTGDMFPHTGFFDANPYPATARALTDTHVLAVPIDAFKQLILDMPSVAIRLIDVMGDKIRELQEKLQQMTGHDVNERLVFLLTRLADKYGHADRSAVRIELPVTNQELANLIGTSRETVNRLLNQLKKRRILDTRRSEIVILDIDALKRWGEVL